MSSNNTFIFSAQRTPVGAFNGSLSSFSAPQLGSTAIQAAIKSSGFDKDKVDECIMGHVLTGGTGQAPARQAWIGADGPTSTQCLTINKVCGSGLKAVMLADDSIRLKHSQVIVCGGQESMSQAPYFLKGARSGYRMGDQKLTDSMIHDGLWDPYNNWHMGNAAELCVKEYQFTRKDQDEFAKKSYEKAQEAQKNKGFAQEITPVELKTRKETLQINEDEEPGKARFDKMANLKPAFDKEGSITAANASKINDGAAALVLATEDMASETQTQPMAKIIAQATFAQDPKWFTTAPIGAIKKALESAKLSVNDIDLWEINEAFSAVTMAAQRDLKIDEAKINVHGGAVAIGHPIGASGARIFTSLLHAMQMHDKQFGLASLCIGGGEAVAVIVERL